MHKVTIDVDNREIRVPGLVQGLSFDDINTERLHVVAATIQMAFNMGKEAGYDKAQRAVIQAKGNLFEDA